MLIDSGLELLDEQECAGLLGTATVGRVGITVGGLPVILPVNFAVVDGDIVFRTGDGTKLHAASNRTVVAFEVDAYDEQSESGWSVLAIGQCGTVDDPAERAAVAVRVPRSWADGQRDHYVRLRPEMLTGRRIAPV